MPKSTPQGKYIKTFSKRLFKNNPDDPNGIITDNGTEINLDPSTPQQSMDWEKEFDEKFPTQVTRSGNFIMPAASKNIKAFILKREQEVRKEVVEEIRKWSLDNCFAGHDLTVIDLEELETFLSHLQPEEKEGK